MKIVIAIDSFKGSLSSVMAGRAVETGIKRVYPDSETKIFSVADGGEGTAKSLCDGMNGNMKEIVVSDPLGRKITCEYGIIRESNTAVIEMSASSGLTLLTKEERNPLYTTTYGVGEIIKDAISEGCRNFIVGIGGSATNDGGVGMLSALGFEFLDKDGKRIASGARGLENLCSIESSGVIPELSECVFNIACDVTNPLCGDSGCSAVYGPQKGADDEMIKNMDLWLERYAEISKSIIPEADKNFPGCGAAGGMGFAFMTYLGGKLTGGVGLILEQLGIERHIAECDFVITGEGRLDRQTVMGKTPHGVAMLAKKHRKSVIAFSGIVSKDAGICNENGIDAFFPVVRGITTIDEAMDENNAFDNIADTVEQAFRLIKMVR